MNENAAQRPDPTPQQYDAPMETSPGLGRASDSGLGSESTGGWSRKLSGWSLAHLRALLGTLGLLARAPLASAITTSIIGLALALPLGLYVAVDGLVALSQKWDRGAQLTVFLNPSVSDSQAKALARTWAKRDGIRTVRALGRSQVLNEFQSITGLDGLAGAFSDGNPMPAVLVVDTIGRVSDPSTRPGLQALAGELRGRSEVDFVEFDTQWLVRVHGLLEVFSRAASLLGVLLVTSLLLVVGNVVRAMVEQRRDEVEIAKLFGASDAFVRRPFLYAGGLLGFVGAIVGWFILVVSANAISEPINSLVALYPGATTLGTLEASTLGLLVTMGVSIGWLGAWFAAWRQLHHIEP
ncbi:MAG: cell division transport system permease protein [Gammaproteobacteria bacterium]|jgi:cell division transport system permease protein